MTTEPEDAADMRRRATSARQVMADVVSEADRRVLQEFAEELDASAARLEQSEG